MAGIAIGLLLEYLEGGYTRPEQLERDVRLPVLTSVALRITGSAVPSDFSLLRHPSVFSEDQGMSKVYEALQRAHEEQNLLGDRIIEGDAWYESKT